MSLNCLELTQKLKTIKQLKLKLDQQVQEVLSHKDNQQLSRPERIQYFHDLHETRKVIKKELKELKNEIYLGSIELYPKYFKEKIKSQEEYDKLIEQIEEKINNDKELEKEELILLYRVGFSVRQLGFNENRNKLEKLKSKRENQGADLSMATGFKPEEISLTKDEALKNNIKYHNGDLYLRNFTSAENLKLPDYISDDLGLSNFTSAENLKLPDYVGGYLDLNGLISAKNLRLPNYVGGWLDLRGLASAKDLEPPDYVGGDLDLRGLASADNLELPKEVKGTVYFRGLSQNDFDKIKKKYPNLKIKRN